MRLYASEQKKTGLITQPSSAKSSKADEVVLSEAAQSFSKILQTAQKNISNVREEKVAELTKRIENGSYKVDSQAVAEKLLQNLF
jgi:negative regulator of flagellin synthesis FlgM